MAENEALKEKITLKSRLKEDLDRIREEGRQLSQEKATMMRELETQSVILKTIT